MRWRKEGQISPEWDGPTSCWQQDTDLDPVTATHTATLFTSFLFQMRYRCEPTRQIECLPKLKVRFLHDHQRTSCENTLKVKVDEHETKQTKQNIKGGR